MTLEELEKSLPNGLHDAQIRSLARNFENETATMSVRILIGFPEDSPSSRDAYRNASIIFTGVKLFVLENPDASSAFLNPGSLWFTVSRTDAGALPLELVDRLERGMLLYSFFILDWHSNMHIAASEIAFNWDAKSPS
jgi:hypothetical protein